MRKIKIDVVKREGFLSGADLCFLAPRIYTTRAKSEKQEEFLGYKIAIVFCWLKWDFQFFWGVIESEYI